MTSGRKTVVLTLAGLLLSVCAVTAQQQEGDTVSDALLSDARLYAERFGTEVEEALRRLKLQARIGVLDEVLEEAAKETYGGLWIEHEPEFKIVALFTEDAPARAALSEDAVGELSEILETRRAEASLVQLESRLKRVQERLQTAGARADLSINVRKNQVEVLTPEPQEVLASLAANGFSLPARTEVVGVPSLLSPQADIRGGRPIADFGTGTGCTSGFSVRTSTGVLGLATAGHCDNGQTYQDTFTSLTFQSERFRGSQDVQWHTATCSDTIRNEIFDGSGNRTITGTVSRSAQSVGEFVCKYGRTTLGTCGTIETKSLCPSYVPSGATTFVGVRGSSPISLGGDSGGPWYSGNRAYGIHSGGDSGTLAIYMPVDSMNSQGYSVLTYQAGVTPYAVVTCFRDTYGFSCGASARNGSPPYTFQNWQYFGPATSWNGSGSGISGTYGSAGCESAAYNSVIVEVRDSCGRVGHGSATFYCPNRDECPQQFLCDVAIGD